MTEIVYIASPLAGDVEGNLRFAREACRYAVERGATPLASHLLYPQFLRDDDPAERALGTQMGLALIGVCQELWVCGDRVSQGLGNCGGRAAGHPVPQSQPGRNQGGTEQCRQL